MDRCPNVSRLAVDVDSIRKAIELTGHIALDGLLFKYDSAELLPESNPVVEQIALYIGNEPKKRFYIVGHTDDKGEQSYNKTLSQSRAEKIIRLLTEKHKLNKDQLEAEGAGEFVPIASNLNVEGRQLNRRVELVLRSDSK